MTKNNSTAATANMLHTVAIETADKTKKNLAATGIVLGMLGIGVSADSITLISKFALVGVIEFASGMLETDSDLDKAEAELNEIMATSFSEFRKGRQAAAKKNAQPAADPEIPPAADSPAAA